MRVEYYTRTHSQSHPPTPTTPTLSLSACGFSECLCLQACTHPATTYVCLCVLGLRQLTQATTHHSLPPNVYLLYAQFFRRSVEALCGCQACAQHTYVHIHTHIPVPRTAYVCMFVYTYVRQTRKHSEHDEPIPLALEFTCSHPSTQCYHVLCACVCEHTPQAHLVTLIESACVCVYTLPPLSIDTHLSRTDLACALSVHLRVMCAERLCLYRIHARVYVYITLCVCRARDQCTTCTRRVDAVRKVSCATCVCVCLCVYVRIHHTHMWHTKHPSVIPVCIHHNTASDV